jgi:hypothetical protein
MNAPVAQHSGQLTVWGVWRVADHEKSTKCSVHPAALERVRPHAFAVGELHAAAQVHERCEIARAPLPCGSRYGTSIARRLIDPEPPG